MSILNDYFAALDRLKKNEPLIVPKNSKITNDSVALEAGRAKGSIKKSRHIFADLILAISNASNEQNQIKNPHIDQIEKLKEEVNFYKKSWEESLAREVSLINEIFELKKELKEIKQSNVLPFKK